MSQQALLDGIKTKLYADSGAGGVAALTSSRIHEAQGEHNGALPAITYFVVTDPPDRSLTHDGLNAQLQIDVWGDKGLGVKATRAISDRLFDLLNRGLLTVSGFNGVQVLCEDRGQVEIDEDAIRIMTQWIVFGTSAS